MILPLITGPYVARVLGPQGVGINTYTGAIIQYFVLFGGLGIGLYGNRQIAYVRDNRQKLSNTFWEIQILKVITVSVAFIGFCIYLFFIHEYRIYLILQSLYIFATGFDISWLYEGIEDFKKTFTRNTLVRIISLVLILFFVKDAKDVWLYILILAVSNLAGYVALWPTLSKVIDNVDFKRLRPFRHLKGIIVLFVPFLALNIYPVINKTILKSIVGIDSSGYYEKSDVMIRMALAIVTSISAVMLPHTSKAFAENKLEKIKDLLGKSFDYVSLLSFPIAFGMAAIAPKFGVFFYGSGFKPVGNAMFIEAFAIIFMGWSSIVGNQYLIPTRQTNFYSKSVIIGSLINIFLDVPLINLFGLNGAALATVISEGYIAVYQIWVIRKQVRLTTVLENIIKYIVSALIMFIFVFVISGVFKMTVISLIIQIIVGFLVYLLFLKVLKPTTLQEVSNVMLQILKRN